MACNSFESVFETETLTITKVSGTQVNVRFELKTFGDASCSGAPTATEVYEGTATIDEQVTLTYDGQPTVFDQITAEISGEGTLKWTASVLADGQLVVDFEDNDAGSSPLVYPSNPNEGESVYTKQ
jgi:hypothetical protein